MEIDDFMGFGTTLNKIYASMGLQNIKGFPSNDKGIYWKGDSEINDKIVYGMEIFE